jgi:hypothetical protein
MCKLNVLGNLWCYLVKEALPRKRSNAAGLSGGGREGEIIGTLMRAKVIVHYLLISINQGSEDMKNKSSKQSSQAAEQTTLLF